MIVQAGIVFSSELLRTGWFQALAAFVAVNTIVYAALALVKLIPRRREKAGRGGERHP